MSAANFNFSSNFSFGQAFASGEKFAKSSCSANYRPEQTHSKPPVLSVAAATPCKKINCIGNDLKKMASQVKAIYKSILFQEKLNNPIGTLQETRLYCLSNEEIIFEKCNFKKRKLDTVTVDSYFESGKLASLKIAFHFDGLIESQIVRPFPALIKVIQ